MAEGSEQVICNKCGQSCKNMRGLGIHRGKAKCMRNQQAASTQQAAPFTTIQSDFPALLRELRRSVPLISRIPKDARTTVAEALTKTIQECVRNNSVKSWEDLSLFPYKCFHLPQDSEVGKPKESLTSAIKRQCAEKFAVPKPRQPRAKSTRGQDISRAVNRKFDEAAISAAVRIMQSDDTVAPVTPETLAAMRHKHPAEPADADYGPDPFSQPPTAIMREATTEELYATIKSFPNGSAGGIDGLRPQHLKDLLGRLEVETSKDLLQAITDLINLILRGGIPDEFCPVFYGAALTALRKKDGGLRPIAVGSTIRRVAAKIVSFRQVGFGKTLSENHQYGFGVSGGAEACVHGARCVISSSKDDGRVFVKIDCANAFNAVRRDQLLKMVKSKMPEYYKFIWQSYRHPSHLFFGDELLQSASGVQQGDPLGPLLFSLLTIEIDSQLESPFRCMFLDDICLEGPALTVAIDIATIIDVGGSFGLVLNPEKCEVFAYGGDANDRADCIEIIERTLPTFQQPTAAALILLGSPLLSEAIPTAMDEKVRKARLMADRLPLISAHQALFILKNCLSMPKVLYTLRTAPTWQFPEHLNDYDTVIREAFCNVANVDMSDGMWAQAALPVANGGMGFRLTVELSIPAYLASVHAVGKLVHSMVNGCAVLDVDEVTTTPAAMWAELAGQPCPPEEHRGSQRIWDQPLLLKKQQELLESANTKDKARLLAVSSKESGLWLNAVPMSSMGTLLDDVTLRIAVGLRLGARLCGPHRCSGCGKEADIKGYHGLSCKNSAGRWSRHNAINKTVQRALASAGFPSIMEPPGLDRGNGKRPDGMTLLPWSQGRAVVWDATIVDTVCQSYVQATSQTAGHAANAAEARKAVKYRALCEGRYFFAPVGFETMGSWGESAKKFIHDIGKHITERTGEVRATSFLKQRVSIDLQRGNAASVLGTLPDDQRLDCIFYILDVKAPSLA